MATNDRKKSFIGSLLRIAGVLLLCGISAVVGGAATRHFGTSSYTMSYADFVSIMLSAISVLMTVLAIFLGVLGVIGWNSITSRVRDRTEEFLNEGFKEGNPLHAMLRERTTEIMYEGVRPLATTNEADDIAFEDPPAEDGEGAGNG